MQVDEFARGECSMKKRASIRKVKAGSKITVKGRILTPEEGALAEDFTGTVHPTVLDSEEGRSDNS